MLELRMQPFSPRSAVLALALVACGNAPPAAYHSVSGERHATGEAYNPEDTATTTGDDTGDTAVGGDGAPVITDAWYEYATDDQDSNYILVHLAVTDAEGDLEGGMAFYILDDGTSSTQGDRVIVAADDVEDYSSEQAALSDAEVTFFIGPIEAGDYQLDGLQVSDTAGHTSEQASLAVTEDGG